MYEGQLDYAEMLLDLDVENNSAWSYRYFLLNKQPESTAGTVAHVLSEIEYLFDKRLPKSWSNEAAWVYLRGLYETKPSTNTLSKVKRVPLKEIV